MTSRMDATRVLTKIHDMHGTNPQAHIIYKALTTLQNMACTMVLCILHTKQKRNEATSHTLVLTIYMCTYIFELPSIVMHVSGVFFVVVILCVYV